ncbi:MAG: AIPR family protein [Flavobacteriales bacterium]|nr:AIPR family protein [Flavobacteriales bacterium]MCB9190387.1 AIPR family protein [Flavobacteriales bacterium]MCB9204636.1 AIPR family protein [Flavobacteriales bacterium]
MANNDQIILDTLIEQTKAELYPDLSADDYFTLYASEQCMKDHSLSYDELDEGIVDNGGDGGIDAIYTLINGELVQRDSEIIEGKRGSTIDVYIIQSKNTSGFSETAIEKCISSASDLFDFDKSIDGLRTVYNNDLLANIDVFRKQYLSLASKFPSLNFHYLYASKGVEVHPNVERKVEMLRATINRHFDAAQVNLEFITAQKLIELARKEQIQSKDVLLADNPISTQDGGYIAIAPIRNYFEFITDDEGKLIQYFFDANIRDYQTNVEVNKGIRLTLNEANPEEDFWWLNNGITITAGNATFASKRLHIEDPQVVNGLQTSFELFKYFTENKIDSDNRNVLLRVITAPNEKSRLRVIKATNSQTSIPLASLRAADPIHRDIEDYLIPKGYFYDRRKNYHKNQGRSVKKIISIPYLAQIVMSTLSQKPDYARARPSTLIKNASDYTQIFSNEIPINVYYIVIEIQRMVESALKEHVSPQLNRLEIGDIKFHVTMFLTCVLTGKIKPTKNDISSINLNSISTTQISDSIDNIYVLYDAMGGNNSVAKGKEFVKEVLELAEEKLKE